jgi:pimeloyl-ACP methyl ester carboxylesterase
MLLHGLWADWSAWDNFAPTSGTDESDLWSLLIPGTNLFPINYNQNVNVSLVTPSYFPPPSAVLGSAMGFEFNANAALPMLVDDISTFAGFFDVAAVQADVIAHSMGGDITRAMALPDEPWTFQTNANYGQGPIEKLITIGTPHLGSPLATQLLPSGQTDPNSCVRRVLKFGDDIALQTATVSGKPWPGGIGDLVGDGQDANIGTTSLTLEALYTALGSGSQPFPMVYLAGTETSSNLADLSSCSVSGCLAAAINFACGEFPFNDPLANDLTTTNWPNVFGGSASDGVVPLTSQLNGATTGGSPGGGGPITNVIHSSGLYTLGFIGLYELNSGPMAINAVDLLNEAKSGPDFQR